MYIEVKGETLRILIDALQAYKTQLLKSREDFKILSDEDYRIKLKKVTKLIDNMKGI